ncbi:hypothetical protein GGTG_00312 [Gaeumannomyces tritici R3-111a-1]|uniref:Uncharacterized protein n=1 Tax=Gaeumannomyces tritici (strain R3-111a-1) TaxID=644352 RepID=J3NGC1_GAET3|nr:hypothetical protein GGTG_00312 [Gaeumannomyces tritici R3-111a-1]EJT80311.1 hypothetical protein GGTG_00312 [Gaeumannomyces tritici R3-111a-1]
MDSSRRCARLCWIISARQGFFFFLFAFGRQREHQMNSIGKENRPLFQSQRGMGWQGCRPHHPPPPPLP